MEKSVFLDRLRTLLSTEEEKNKKAIIELFDNVGNNNITIIDDEDLEFDICNDDELMIRELSVVEKHKLQMKKQTYVNNMCALPYTTLHMDILNKCMTKPQRTCWWLESQTTPDTDVDLTIYEICCLIMLIKAVVDEKEIIDIINEYVIKNPAYMYVNFDNNKLKDKVKYFTEVEL